MAWIETVKPKNAGKELREAMIRLRSTFPPEYAGPVAAASSKGESIVESQTLIPDALYHGFMTMSAVMSDKLPLERKHHEMIATVVSKANECHY